MKFLLISIYIVLISIRTNVYSSSEKLVYLSYHGLISYNFKNKKETYIFNFIEGTKISSLAGITEIKKGKVVGSFMRYEDTSNYLYLIDTVDGKYQKIGKGEYPLYIPHANELLFFNDSPSGQGMSLFTSKISKENNIIKTEVIDDGPFTSGSKIFLINKRLILYQDSGNRSWTIDLKDREKYLIKSLDGYFPILWVPESNELICGKVGSKKIISFSYDNRGEFIEGLEIPNLGVPLVKMNHSNKLLFLIEYYSINDGPSFKFQLYDLTKKKGEIHYLDNIIVPHSILE